MMKVVSGKIFYQLKTQYSDDFIIELKIFLSHIGMPELNLNKIKDEKYLEKGFKFSQLSYNISIKKNEDKVTLLFETDKPPEEFYDLICKFFEVDDAIRQLYN